MRLPDHYLSAGELTSRGWQALRDRGLLDLPAPSTYGATVLTATDCNFGCSYCFQNTGEAPRGTWAPPRIARERLSPARISSICDFIRAHMHAQMKSDLSLLLFGGEPLLDARGCLALLEKLRPVIRRSSMVSNGYLLTECMGRRLHEAGLQSVQVTLDGDRDAHDAVRSTRGGLPSFDHIIENVACVQDSTRLRIGLRVNVTSTNLASLPSLLDHLNTRLAADKTTLEFAVVRDYEWNATGSKLPVSFAESLLACAEEATGLGFKMFGPSGYDCIFCSGAPLETGSVISPSGDLYSSWETAGRRDLRVGHISTGYTNITADTWLSCHDFHRTNAANSSGVHIKDEYEARLLDMLYDPLPA